MVRAIPPGLVFGFLGQSALVLSLYLLALWLVLGPSPEARRRIRLHALYLAVFFSVFAIDLANCKRHMQVDTQPAAFAAMSLVRHGWFDLTPFESNIAPVKQAVCIIGVDGRTYSRYPPGSTLVCVPFVASFAQPGSRITYADIDFASKRAGALCAALAVVFVFAAMRRLVGGPSAWIAAVALGFGTTLFSTGSQDAWQHAPAMLGLAVALYGLALTFPDRPRSAWVIGLGLAWAFISRPTMALPALAISAYFLARDRRRFVYLALGALPLAMFWIYFASAVYGSPLRTGYYYSGGYELQPHFASNLWNVFFNPSRGIFIYSPFLVLGLAELWPMLRESWRRRHWDARRAALGAFATSGLLVAGTVAATNQWPGGWSYGYRSASESALLLLPPFAFAAARLWKHGLGKAVLVAVVAVSIGIHALEVVFPNDLWNAHEELQRQPQILVHLDFARATLAH